MPKDTIESLLIELQSLQLQEQLVTQKLEALLRNNDTPASVGSQPVDKGERSQQQEQEAKPAHKVWRIGDRAYITNNISIPASEHKKRSPNKGDRLCTLTKVGLDTKGRSKAWLTTDNGYAMWRLVRNLRPVKDDERQRFPEQSL